jgi:MoaA/NifB/PqqE/SkfB family radical SAM enzyme
MYFRLAKRLLLETDKRLLWKLVWSAGFKGMRSIQKHKRRLRRGEFFPPFIYISPINSCNLRCQGCWVDVSAKQSTISLEALDRILQESKALGNSFFGILGGEPLMHPDLLEILRRHPDCYFQIFTNGHLITDEVAAQLREVGNASPLISVEGNEIISDQRRGRPDVWDRTMAGLQNCVKHKLITGVCTSLCQTNLDLLTESWLDRLIELGVLYAWFHIYRAVGPQACPELSLQPDQQRRAREFVVEMRAKKPIIIVDAYHDGLGSALCPAAIGFTHHIGPWGDVEPCPVIQLAKESIHGEQSLAETFANSAFLRDFRETAASYTRGCILLERPDLLRELAARHDARDTTARGTVLAELEAMHARSSQYNPGLEIPEKSWAYRLAKRLCFHDYGAYTRHFRPENWRDPRAAASQSPGEREGVSPTVDGPQALPPAG